MTAFEISVLVPARVPLDLDPETGDVRGGGELIPGQFVPDFTIIEGYETRDEAENAAVAAFPEGTKLVKNGTSEVPTAEPPALPGTELPADEPPEA